MCDACIPASAAGPCREQWQRECVKLLDNPRLWDECQQASPETAEALHVTLSIMSGVGHS